MSYPGKHRDSFTYSNQRNRKRGYEAFNQYSPNRYRDVSDVAENSREDKNQCIDGLSQRFSNKIFPSESDDGGYRSMYLDSAKNLYEPDSRFRDRTSTGHKNSVYFDDNFQRRNEMRDMEEDYRASYHRSFDDSRNDPDFERFSGGNKSSFSERRNTDAKLSYHHQCNNKNSDELNPQPLRIESPYRAQGTVPVQFPEKVYSYRERRSTSPQFSQENYLCSKTTMAGREFKQHDTKNIDSSEQLSQGYHLSAKIRRTDCKQFSDGNYRYSERQGCSQEQFSRDNDVYSKRTRDLESMQHEQCGGVIDLISDQSSRGNFLYSRRQEQKPTHEQFSQKYDLYSKGQSTSTEKVFRENDLPYEGNTEDVEYSYPLKFKYRNERTEQFSQSSDSPSKKRNPNLELFSHGDSYSDRDFRSYNNDFLAERRMRDSERFCHKQFDDTSERRVRVAESYNKQFYDKSERTCEEFSRDNFDQSNPSFAQWSHRGETFSERQDAGQDKPSDLSPKRNRDLELFCGRELENKNRTSVQQFLQVYNSSSERKEPDSLRNHSYFEKRTDNLEYFYEQQHEDRNKITLKPFSQGKVSKEGFDSDFHDKHGDKESYSLQQFSPKNQSRDSFVEQQEYNTQTKDFPIMLEEVKSTTGPYGFLVVHYLCKEHPLETLYKTATDFNLKLQEDCCCNKTTGMWETNISLNGIHLSSGENVYKEESKTRACEIGVEKLRNLYFTVLFFDKSKNTKGIIIDAEGCKWKSAVNKLLSKKVKNADVKYWKSLLPVRNVDGQEIFLNNDDNFSQILEPIKTLEKAENVIKEYYNSEDVNDYSICHNLKGGQLQLLRECADRLGIENAVYSCRIKGKFIKFLRISKNLEMMDLVNRLIKNNYSLGFGIKYKLLRPGQPWDMSPNQIVYQYDKRKNMYENKY